MLGHFWPLFDAVVQASNQTSVRDVIDVLDANLSAHFFPLKDGQTEDEARACPACAQRGQQGRLGLKLSKTGGFIGCSNYPDCGFQRPLELVESASSSSDDEEDVDEIFPGLADGASACSTMRQLDCSAMDLQGHCNAQQRSTQLHFFPMPEEEVISKGDLSGLMKALLNGGRGTQLWGYLWPRRQHVEDM